MIDLLLTHADVITMDPQRRVYRDGAVAIRGRRIAAVGPTAELAEQFPAGRVLDCRGKIVLPGLVNAHSHCGHSLIGKLNTDKLEEWRPVILSSYENYADDAFWNLDARLNACQTVRKGITTSVNVLGATPMADEPSFARSHADGYAEVGSRTIVGMGFPYGPYPKSYTRFRDGKAVHKSVGYDDLLAGVEEALQTVHGAHGGLSRVFVTLDQQLLEHDAGIHGSTDLLSLTEGELELNRRIRELAARYHTRIYTDTFGGWISAAYLDKRNMLLGPDVLVGMEHVMGTDFNEIEILRETGTSVYYTAEGYYKRVPLCSLMDAGIPLAVTTNACAPRTMLDLLESLRRAMTAEAIFADDDSFFQSGKALETVTIDAARAIGWADEIGSLEAGKRADIAVLDCAAPKFLGLRDPVQRVVYEAAGDDFCTVIVNGSIIMENRVIQTVDEDAILREAEEAHARLLEDCGLRYAVNEPIWGRARISYLGR